MVDTREARLAAFVDALVAELAPLEKRHNESYWLANITGEERHERESAALDAQMRKIFARREPYRMLQALAGDGPLADREQRIQRMQREIADKTDRLARLAKEMGELKARRKLFR